VVLGFLDPETFFGGQLKLDRGLAEAAIAKVAEPLGMSLEQAAAAVHQVADAKMSDLMRSATVHQGIDPRGYAVYAFGGGGGTHAAIYAKSLECRELVIPRADVASVWSALGIAVADLTHSIRQPMLLREPFDVRAVQEQFDELERQATEYIDTVGQLAESIEVRRHVACKYGMQVFEVVADMPSGPVSAESLAAMSDDFERRYAASFGEDAGYREAGIVITALSVSITGTVAKQPLAGVAAEARPAAAHKLRHERDVYWHELGARRSTPVWSGELLEPGDQVAGPAVVEYPHTTVVVRPEMTMTVDGLGSLRIVTTSEER
jgi:N-methylhydantoinase A